MAFNYNRAFTVDDNGVTFTDENQDNVTNISTNDFNPSITGQDAPIGSLFMRAGGGGQGTLYFKSGAAVTAWSHYNSLSYINSCRVATTGDVSIAAPGASIDGVALNADDRVLVRAQTTTTENGIYIWNGAAVPMERASDMDTYDEVPGHNVNITEGTQYAASQWISDSAYYGTIGVTPITFTGSFRRIGPNGRFDLGESWTSARANNAFGPRTFSLIDPTAVVRIWRFTATAANPSIELIWGTNDDPANAANSWWDIALNEVPNEGVRIGKRGSATTGDLDAKLFASITGVRIGPDVAETNPAVSLSIDATDSVLVPVGTTGERPTGVEGYLRYNSTTDKFEGFENSAWRNFTTSLGSGNLNLYAENSTGTPTVSATGTNAQAFGDQAVSRLYGAKTYANGSIGAAGDAQSILATARVVTTNATPTVMFLDGAAATQRPVLQNNSAWTYQIHVIARNTGANQAAGYQFTGVIRRDGTAASTTLVGGTNKTVLGENNAAWDVNVTADTTNGALSITVTGVAATTIRWVATIRLTEVLV